VTDVLLTYGWVRSVYAALRNFARHDCRVIVACNEKTGMCQLSKYKKNMEECPSFLRGEQLYVDSIIKLVDKYKPSILLPGHDDTEILARHHAEFVGKTVLPVHDLVHIELANNKSRTQEVAKAAGVMAPTRIYYESIEQLRCQMIGSISNKLVIRLRKGNSAKGVFYASTGEECCSIVERLINEYALSEQRFPVVQEYVTGEGWGVSCLYWHGERIAHFTHHRLREKTTTGGTSTLREHQPNKIIEDMAFRLLDSLSWHGLAMVEFKYDPVSETAWFIEINPRLWGSIHLAISAGVEFPYLLYLCATKGPEVAKQYQKSSLIKYPWRARWYLGDVICATELLKKGKVYRALRLLAPGGTNTYDDIDRNDPGAFIGEVLHYGAGFLKSGSANPVEKGMLG